MTSTCFWRKATSSRNVISFDEPALARRLGVPGLLQPAWPSATAAATISGVMNCLFMKRGAQLARGAGGWAGTGSG